MGANSVTGVGPGMSNGVPKPENNCGCGCYRDEDSPDPPPKKFCFTRHKSGNTAFYKSGGGLSVKVC